MNTKTPYTYTTLRYIHDITTGEFLNVGVALFAPEQRFLNVQCRTTYTRLREVFPSLDGESFRAAMRHVMNRFESFGEEVRDQLALRSTDGTVMEFAHNVLAKDDSSLQWSPAGSGLTRDPAATLEQLFNRMVMRNETKTSDVRKKDEDVWRNFSRALEQRQLLKHFEPKVISVKDDEVLFQHAWKNGVWHCLAPVSFDLAHADSIKDKAHRWLGQLTSVKDAGETFQMYFLVGQPSQPELRTAFDSAISILKKSPFDSKIFFEDQTDTLTGQLASEVAAHLAGQTR